MCVSASVGFCLLCVFFRLFSASSFVGCGARRVLRILVLILVSPQFSPYSSPCCGSGWAGMRGFLPILAHVSVSCHFFTSCFLPGVFDTHDNNVMLHVGAFCFRSGWCISFSKLSTHFCFNIPAKSGCLDRTTTRCHFERVGSSGKLISRNG